MGSKLKANQLRPLLGGGYANDLKTSHYTMILELVVGQKLQYRLLHCCIAATNPTVSETILKKGCTKCKPKMRNSFGLVDVFKQGESTPLYCFQGERV